MGSTSAASREKVTNADAKIAAITGEMDALKAEVEAEIEKISSSYEPEALAIETESLKPTRSDVKVERVALLWLPVG